MTQDAERQRLREIAERHEDGTGCYGCYSCSGCHDLTMLVDARVEAIIAALLEALAPVEAERDRLRAALAEYLAAAENSVTPADDDDIKAMLRFAKAEDAARAALTPAGKA